MVQPILGGTKRTADLGRSGSDPRFGTTNINQSQRVFPHDMALVRSPVHPSRHWACQIALAVARCSFWDASRNLLGTLGLSDRSRCGAVFMFKVKEILRRDLDYRELL